MAEIQESDLMLVCLAASKAIAREYDMELNNATRRIRRAMSEGGRDGEVITVTRLANNPIDRDVATRCLVETVNLILRLDDK